MAIPARPRPRRSTGAAAVPRSVIALVASVGGLEAVGEVLAGLPGTLEATVLVLLHQQPDRTGDLVHLLRERSVLGSAAEDANRLGSGEVLVAPAGKHLLIASGPTIRLILSGAAPPSRPSADLLTSMALTLGTVAVVVVLSGNGHDGATAPPRSTTSAARSWPPTKPPPRSSRCPTRPSVATT